ncbi:MAG: TIGR02710 family CRISPR-associated CARF protein [bacterium]
MAGNKGCSDLERQLAAVADMWLKMPVGEEEAAEAARYYREEVFPLTCRLCVERERKKMAGKQIYGLILTVGTSPEPLILSLLACQPQKALFLYTEDTERYLDDIINYVQLSPSRWDKRLVQKSDPRTIYQVVKEIWEQWGRRSDIAVDITGGTKSMTGGLALVGAFLGFELLYVDNERYLKEQRRPYPGTECLKVLPNPYTVFGALKEKNALELLRRQEFHGAGQILTELVEKVPDPRRFQYLLALARAYEAWDGLNLKEACDQLGRAAAIAEKLHWGEATDETIFLREQQKRVGHLAELLPAKPRESTLPLLQDREAVETLVFTLYHNARRRAAQGKWDAASFFLYRLLEIMEQRRLALYGIDTARPDYSLLPGEGLLDKFNAVRQQIKFPRLEELPSPIALTDGYFLLEALADPLRLSAVPTGKGVGIHWGRFCSQIENRNYSILAHGFIFVSEEQYLNFKEMVEQILDLFCTVEGIDGEEAREKTWFLTREDVH